MLAVLKDASDALPEILLRGPKRRATRTTDSQITGSSDAHRILGLAKSHGRRCGSGPNERPQCTAPKSKKMADKRAYCLGVDARATRGPAGATVKRCACEVAQYMLFGRANARARTTEASVYAFNCKESDNDLHTDDQELGLNVVKLLRMEKTGAPGIIKTCFHSRMAQS